MSYNTGAEAFSYIVSTNGTVVSALNTTTGRVEFSGTDAGPVFRSIFTALSSGQNGAVYVKKGTYNINTFVQESGGSYHPYYAIRIPTAATANFNDMHSYKLIGESPWHTIINITTTAISTLSGSDTAIGIWQQYTSAASTFTDFELRSLRVQFPDNQRGNQHVVDLRYGSRAAVRDCYIYCHDYTGNVGLSDPAVAGTDGTYCLRMPNNSQVTACLLDKVSVAGGYDGFILPELTVATGIEAANCVNGYHMGMTGTTNFYHHAVLVNCIDSSNNNGLILGPTMQAGSGVDIFGMGVEYATTGDWTRASEATEATPGNTSGSVSYTTVLGGTGIVNRAFWANGSGTKFITQQSNGGVVAGSGITLSGGNLTTNASALTANLPVIGAGSNATAVGTRSGNTTTYVTTTGAQTSGDYVKIDANGNHIAGGGAVAGGITIGTSTITSGAANRLLYETSGNVVGELILGTNLSISGGNTLDAGGGTGTFPAFSVSKSADQTGLVSAGYRQITGWDTEEYDTNNNFASDTFTPTVAGKYVIIIGVLTTGLIDGSVDAQGVAIYKNGSAYMQFLHEKGGVGQLSFYGNCVVDMNGSTDAITVYVYVTTTSGTFSVIHGSFTKWQGYRINA